MASRKTTRPRFSEDALYQLDCLLEFASAQELREYLFEIYHSYIIHEHEMFPANFPEMARSMQVLFDFLKFMEHEQHKK